MKNYNVSGTESREESFDEAIDRLVQMMEDGDLNEIDFDEVAEAFGVTREEVQDCCLNRHADLDCATPMDDSDID